MQVNSQIEKGIAHRQKGDDVQAVDCFRQSLAGYPKDEVVSRYQLGKTLINIENDEAARREFETLSNAHPKRSAGLIGQARLTEAMKQWEKALDSWDTCLTRFSEQSKPFWYKQRGLVLMQLGRFDESQRQFTELDHQFPMNPLGQLGMALVTFEMQQWQQSLSHWEKCFERFPGHAKAWWYDQFNRTRIAAGTLKIDEEVAKRGKTSAVAKAYFSMLEDEFERPTESSTRLNFESILVITYGRSGSTLLQGMLNTVEGLLIRGENLGVFLDFFNIHEALVGLKRSHSSASILPEQPWYGVGGLDVDKLLGHFKDTARTIILGDQINNVSITCYGFKEIRHVDITARLTDYLDFLANLFPKPAFIFNTRNLNDVVQSAWWTNHDAMDVRRELTELELQFEAYASKRPNCFQITYEDIINKTQRFREMFTFIGAPYHRVLVDGVLATPHSYAPTRLAVRKLYD